MKKILSLLLSGIMLFSFAGCSGAGPEETVSATLDALVTFDADAMEEYLGEGFIKNLVSGINTGNDEKLESQYEQMIKDVFAGIKYEIKETKVADDDKTAIVKISMTNKDFSKVLENSEEEMYKLATKATSLSEKELNSKAVEIVTEEINKASKNDKTATKEVTLNMTKNDDGNWQIANDGNEEFFKALMGGLI